MEVLEEVGHEHLGVGDIKAALLEGATVLALDDFTAFGAEVNGPSVAAKGDSLGVLDDLRGLGAASFLVCYGGGTGNTFVGDHKLTIHVSREFLLWLRAIGAFGC
jgi:hypothetical protein